MKKKIKKQKGHSCKDYNAVGILYDQSNTHVTAFFMSFATHFAENESVFICLFCEKRTNKKSSIIPSFPLISCRHSICLNGSKATHLLAKMQFLGDYA